MKPHLSNLTPAAIACTFLFLAATTPAYYDPATQRWLDRDPLGEPGFSQRLDAEPPVEAAMPYGFVSNDPIGRRDFFGLTDGDTATERCKQKCFEWANRVQRSGGNGKKAYEDCDNGCDRDPNYVPGSPIPPLPTLRPMPPKGFWGACKEIAKTAKEVWKQFRKPKDK